ncbi:hypothetical protein, partial [Nocardia gipuzkoensis]
TNTSGLRATGITSTGSITGHPPMINPPPRAAGYSINLPGRGTRSVVPVAAPRSGGAVPECTARSLLS